MAKRKKFEPREAPLLITVDEAAQLLGISRRSTYYLVERDEISYVRFGKAVRIVRSGVDDYINQHREGGAA